MRRWFRLRTGSPRLKSTTHESGEQDAGFPVPVVFRALEARFVGVHGVSASGPLVTSAEFLAETLEWERVEIAANGAIDRTRLTGFGVQDVVHLDPGRTGSLVLLALAEAHQHQKRWRDAINCLKQLRRHNPDDMLVTLSLAELLAEEVGDKPACKQVVALTAEVKNESDVHAATLLYKAKALREPCRTLTIRRRATHRLCSRRTWR